MEQSQSDGTLISSQSFMSSRERGEEIRKAKPVPAEGEVIAHDDGGVSIGAPPAVADGRPKPEDA